MVHYYNYVNEIQDCSRNGTYHNRRFRDAAEARESAAKLAGQLEAVQAQNATLLAAVQQRSDRGSGGK